MKKPIKKLKGFVKNPDNSMSAVEFRIWDDHSFDTIKDGEIWDTSDDPNDFVDVIEDQVFTKFRDRSPYPYPTKEEDEQVVYSGIVSLHEWFRDNGVPVREVED